MPEKRQHTRFEDFGKIECFDLSPVSGVLEDISLKGCKVHFDSPVSVNTENDYELKIRLSRVNLEPLLLIGHPQWVKSSDLSTDIGFQFLRSRDTFRLESYINKLTSEIEDINQ